MSMLCCTSDTQHPHSANNQNGTNHYDYDVAGNVVWRTDSSVNQTLTWTRANELASITVTDGKQEYLYDADGQRVRKEMLNLSNATVWTVYELFSQYERKVEGSTTTNTKHYFFGGQRIAQKVNSDTFTYLHTDHLGSDLRVRLTPSTTLPDLPPCSTICQFSPNAFRWESSSICTPRIDVKEVHNHEQTLTKSVKSDRLTENSPP